MTLELGELLRILHRNEVRFVVVGGVAVAAHGYVRATIDLDVVPDPDSANIELLAAALTQLGARIPSGARFDPATHAIRLRRGANATLTTANGGLDVVQRLAGVPSYAALDARAVDAHVAGVPVRICSLADLRAMKEAAGRPQDLADLANLPEDDPS